MMTNFLEWIITAVIIVFIIILLSKVIKSRIETAQSEKYVDKKARYGDSSLYNNLLAFVDNDAGNNKETFSQAVTALSDEAIMSDEVPQAEPVLELAELTPINEFSTMVNFNM